MFGRSRSLLFTPKGLLLLLLTVSLLATTGCNRTQPRRHWWEFWKPKATDVGVAHHPDTYVLPPAPGAVGPNGLGSGESVPPEPLSLPNPPVVGDPLSLPEPEPIRTAEAQMISDLHTIYFAFDSFELTSEMQRLLRENAAWIQNRPGLEIQIQGHCDERGTEEYNMSLGQRRAQVVRDFLISLGVDPNRLHTISFGEMRPLNPARTEEAYAQNRRVQFFVY